jgi:polypeptide N-acetylgalactosaminyltransferase
MHEKEFSKSEYLSVLWVEHSYLFCAEHCKKPLDDYVAKHLPNVQVIHLPERSGLIRARLAGATRATAEVLIFLDSHTEASVNWLPPLLGKVT